MTSFLNEEPAFQALLPWVEAQSSEIDAMELADFDLNLEDADITWLNSQLYQVLSLNTVDTA